MKATESQVDVSFGNYNHPFPRTNDSGLFTTPLLLSRGCCMDPASEVRFLYICPHPLSSGTCAQSETQRTPDLLSLGCREAGSTYLQDRARSQLEVGGERACLKGYSSGWQEVGWPGTLPFPEELVADWGKGQEGLKASWRGFYPPGRFLYPAHPRGLPAASLPPSGVP